MENHTDLIKLIEYIKLNNVNSMTELLGYISDNELNLINAYVEHESLLSKIIQENKSDDEMVPLNEDITEE